MLRFTSEGSHIDLEKTLLITQTLENRTGRSINNTSYDNPDLLQERLSVVTRTSKIGGGLKSSQSTERELFP